MHRITPATTAMTAIAEQGPGAKAKFGWPWLAAVLLLGIWLPLAHGQESASHFIPGDAKVGMQAFFEKGCARCHSVLGEGGKSAPDLGRAPTGHLSAAELVAGMWNHAPAMWEKMRHEKITTPAFEESEMSNLFAFLYTVRSLDEPGDAENGRQLLQEKRCLDCHAVAGQGRRVGPDLNDWASYRNPVSWVQAMWNHAPVMQQAMRERNLPWPKFEQNEVSDLIAYIRTRVPNPREHVYLQPPNPDAGRQIFLRKGCVNCHRERDAGSAGPSLGSPGLPRTLGQFAGLMWNHSPSMWSTMRAAQVPRPQFTGSEMADLIAYLFMERYFEARGSRSRGARVFEVKGCAACHSSGAAQHSGPALSPWRGRVSPITLATALWNHGPAMYAQMRDQQVSWPLFQPGEMVDLMEFLNQGADQPATRRRSDQ